MWSDFIVGSGLHKPEARFFQERRFQGLIFPPQAKIQLKVQLQRAIRASLLGIEWKLRSLREEERFLFIEERDKGKKEKARKNDHNRQVNKFFYVLGN